MAGSYGTASGTLTEALCQNLHIAFEQAFPTNDPQMKMEHLGTLKAILEKNTGVQNFVDTGDGSRNEATTASKQVLAEFNPRFNRNGATTTLATGCTVDTESPAKCEVLYYADSPVQSETITMNEYEYRRYCEGAVAYQNNRLVALANQVIERLNYELAIDLVGLLGNYKGGATSNTYTILETDGSQRFSGGTLLRKDLMDALLTGRINIVGWGKWFEYFSNALAGDLADTGQLMNMSTAGMDFYMDPNVSDASVFGNEDHAFIIGQDSLAFHTWNGFKGEYARMNDKEIRTTFVHPGTGIELDLYGFYTDCEAGKSEYQTGNWSFRYTVHYGLQTMPAGIWKADDDFYGINYTFKAIGAQ